MEPAGNRQKASDAYPGRDLNPHSHFWPQDFKSCVSTNFTTRASPAIAGAVMRVSSDGGLEQFPVSSCLLPVKMPLNNNPLSGERGCPERETRLELATLTLAR